MDGSSKRKAWEVGASKTGESVPKRGSLEEGRGAAERAVTRPARVRVSLSPGGGRGCAAGGWNVPREQNRASGGPAARAAGRMEGGTAVSVRAGRRSTHSPRKMMLSRPGDGAGKGHASSLTQTVLGFTKEQR